MDVTESSLASALEGFYVTGRALGGISNDGKVSVEVDDADATAKALYATLSRMAALREPQPAQAGGRLAGITGEELHRALCGLAVTVREPEQPTGSVVGSPEGWKPFSARGKLLHPQDVLIDLVARIREERCRAVDGAATALASTGDPELSAIAQMLALLDELDGASGAGRGSCDRVLTFIASRYGYVLATED